MYVCRYWGAWPCRQLNTVTPTLYATRSETSSITKQRRAYSVNQTRTKYRYRVTFFRRMLPPEALCRCGWAACVNQSKSGDVGAAVTKFFHVQFVQRLKPSTPYGQHPGRVLGQDQMTEHPKRWRAILIYEFCLSVYPSVTLRYCVETA